jgi:bacterioferritin-associated ferredoxin
VTERDVRRAIQSGACSRGDVVQQCGAGSVCGGCHPVIDELLEGPARIATPFGLELAPTS